MRIPEPSNHTVRAVIEQTADCHADTPFIVTERTRLTFGELDRAANRLRPSGI